MSVDEIPAHFAFFLASWWGMVGSGIVIARVFVVERLRVLNGGVESVRLRWGRRVVDTLALLVIVFAAFWLVIGLVNSAMKS